MLYFIASTSIHLHCCGFVIIYKGNAEFTRDIRFATPYQSFQEADMAAKKLGIECYAILSNCIG